MYIYMYRFIYPNLYLLGFLKPCFGVWLFGTDKPSYSNCFSSAPFSLPLGLQANMYMCMYILDFISFVFLLCLHATL